MTLLIADERRTIRTVTPIRPDHRVVPLVEALQRYRAAGTVSFSTPGHKQGAGADAELRAMLGDDVFAHDVWLNTGDHHRALRAAEALAADAWGADRSLFLGNGSTAGNLAFLLATVGPGDEVIVARDVHRSILTGLVLTGARPVFVAPRLHPELQLGLGLAPADVAAALDAHPAARLVVLTSPTYWGVAGDVAGIAAVAHARDIPLYVDEAWGPHFPFHPALPVPALAAGADAAVTSAHKLLGCLSQGALLHLKGPRIDQERVAAAVRSVETTSPSLPILASLDAGRRQMTLHGTELLNRTIALAERARRRLRAVPGLRVLDGAELGAALDPTRLVVDVGGLGLSGCAVERELREYHAVAPEMSDLVGLVFLITIGDTPASIDRLVDSLRTIAATRRQRATDGLAAVLRSAGAAIAPGRQALTPREAHFARTRSVPLAGAAGEVAAEPVIPYPPGMPVLLPGEVVSAEKVAYLRLAAGHGVHIQGPIDSTLATIRVVAETAPGERPPRTAMHIAESARNVSHR